MIKCKNGTEESIQVVLTIGATGTLSDLKVNNGSAEKRNCVAKELKRLQFPPGNSEMVVKKRFVVP